MNSKLISVLFLSAFVAANVSAPAFAAGDLAANKCAKITDVKLKAECLKNASKQKK